MARRKCVDILPGGGATGRCPDEFDPEQLEKMERGLEATPNRSDPQSRVRIYEAETVARNYRETFQASPVESRMEFPFNWPSTMQHVGESLAVAYSSDKWQGKGDYKLYKHLAESPNFAFVVPGLLHDFYEPKQRLKVIGPTVSLRGAPMPKHFALLALFEEINLRLHVGGMNSEPEFGENDDDGVVKVTVPHGFLGASKILWSKKDSGRADQPFLFIYTEADGVLIVVIGEELDVKSEGIVG